MHDVLYAPFALELAKPLCQLSVFAVWVAQYVHFAFASQVGHAMGCNLSAPERSCVLTCHVLYGSIQCQISVARWPVCAEVKAIQNKRHAFRIFADSSGMAGKLC